MLRYAFSQHSHTRIIPLNQPFSHSQSKWAHAAVTKNTLFLVNMSEVHLYPHAKTFSAITNNMHQHDVMSSECWVEPCSQGQAKETGLEKQQEEVAEEEELEVPRGNNRPAGSMRQEEELGRKWSSSPDHSGMEEVTSKRRVEQAQMEKIQTQEKRERFSHLNKSQECRDHRDGVQGLWRAKGDVKCDVSFEQNNKIYPETFCRISLTDIVDSSPTQWWSDYVHEPFLCVSKCQAPAWWIDISEGPFPGA